MNKITKIIIAFLGGLEAVFSVISPIIIAALWVHVFPSNSDWSFYTIGFAASVFRGIKIGGWLRDE